MSVNKLTDEIFDEKVLNSTKTTLVDFWASWCGPCRMLSPIVDEIAEENSDINVYKVNIDEEVDLANRFQIMSIPTLLVFKDGKLADKSVGVIPKDKILKMLK